MTGDLPPMLGVEAVLSRYSLRDARAARRIIADAGGRRIGGRWMVRSDLLDVWERGGLKRINSQPAAATPTEVAAEAGWGGSTISPPAKHVTLEPGWHIPSKDRST